VVRELRACRGGAAKLDGQALRDMQRAHGGCQERRE
jgi:hypothetical protein